MTTELAEIQLLLREFHRPWCFCGGWAIDLFLDKESRPHHDVEIGVFREDQHELQNYLNGWSFRKVCAGQIEVWELGERLELPIHETYANLGRKEIEILFQERQGEQWAFRRDLSITLPIKEAIRFSSAGLPYLAPELVLLYKSKTIREKDEQDWQAVKGSLGDEQLGWLRSAIARTADLKHPWNAPA